MALFFFHFRQGKELAPDEGGAEFATVEDAYLSAFDAARDMWRELLMERQDPRLCSFEVTDSKGRAMFTLPFTEVLHACQDQRVASARTR